MTPEATTTKGTTTEETDDMFGFAREETAGVTTPAASISESEELSSGAPASALREKQ